jgi:hypothetical protein
MILLPASRPLDTPLDSMTIVTSIKIASQKICRCGLTLMLTKISVTCSVDLPANDLNQREIDLVQDPAAHYSIIGEDRKSANDARPAGEHPGRSGPELSKRERRDCQSARAHG